MSWVTELADRTNPPFAINDSKTPSGRAHVGALRGVLIHDSIYRELHRRDPAATTYTFGCDDYDALDELPHGLEVVPGKLVWELRPAVRGDKGDAVRRVVAESAAREVVVVGDDLGDLAAFAAVAGLTAEGGDGLRVAVRSAEAPPALLAEADLVVEGPAGVLDFLQRLAA